MDTSKVTRFELIDHRLPLGVTGVQTGRIVGMHGCKVELSLQDDGKTLKVFVSGDRE